MDQTEEIYKIVNEKIDANGVSLLSDLHPGTTTVVQRASINGTQLVLSYNYNQDENGFCRLNHMSVGHIIGIKGKKDKYKPVSGFYDKHAQEIIKKVLQHIPATGLKTPALDLVRALADNKVVQK